MKMKLTMIAAMVALVSPMYAATFILSNVITGTGDGDALIQKENGGLLSGGYAAMGHFPAGYVISTNVSDIQATISNFILGTANAWTTLGGMSVSLGIMAPGYMETDKIPGAQVTGTNALIGRAIYLFVGNGATLASSSEWALKEVAKYGDDVPNEQEYLANPLGGMAPVVGKVGTYTGDASGFGSSTFSTLQMVAIPETSTALLGALGALGLLRRRR